ncbi:MAG: HpcH/HpaI aldolase family protein [Rhodospirillales bacterium]|jgi:2-keto-3-deoxy-L-rhamnonate aldolase RhmA
MIANPVRRRIEAGGVALGVGVRVVRGVEIAKLMKVAGFDWLFIDLEHGQMSIDAACQISVAALDAGIAPLVRVPMGQTTMGTRCLDGGALGIVMPHVDTPEEARAIADAYRYPPVGHRSIVGGLPQVAYASLPIGEAAATINAATLVAVMIETPKAVANADAIAAVPGIDMLLMGCSDLTLEMGIPGQFEDPRLVAAIETVIAACRRHGRIPAIGGIYAEALLARYLKLGMQAALAGNDLPLLLGAATQRAKAMRDMTS